MNTWSNITGASVAIFAGGAAFAGIAYDTITNAAPTPTVTHLTTPWHAEDTFLDLSSSNTLDRVELLTRLSLVGTPPSFSGFLTIGVFTCVPMGSFTLPGTLLESRTIQHTWTQGVSEVLAADFSGVTLASNSIWVGWMFANSAGVPLNPAQGVPFVTKSTSAPLIGSTTSATAGANSALGIWQLQTGSAYRAVRVVMVPAPATIAVLGLGAIGLRRRRSI